MRRAVIRSVLPLLVAFACACASESVGRPPPPPVNWASLAPRPAPADAGVHTATGKERQATDAYVKALGSPGFVGLGSLLDEDVHFTFAGFRDVHGRDSAIKMHQALLGAFDARSFEATRVLLTDSSQVLEWTMSGVHTATHKPVVFRGLTLLWTKDDGSFSDVHLYFDEALVRAQLGVGPKGLVLPPPPATGGVRIELEQARTAEETANVAVVRASLEAFENKNEAAYLAALTDDVEVTLPEGARPMRGKADARAHLKAMHGAIRELDTSVDNAWGIGGFVVVEYHVVGEQRGALSWVPAQKDNLLKMFVVDVAELQGGRIARMWRYDNPSQILSSPLREP